MSQVELKLPSAVLKKADFIKLVEELERLDAELVARAARQQVANYQESPLTASEATLDFIKLNQIDIQSSAERSKLLRQLRRLRAQLPVTHLTFASEIELASLAQLVGWLRQNVHYQTVVEVGLQPGLIAGMHMRTSNQAYDYSLKSRLKSQRQLLVDQLGALSGS